jgi:hypothetical protein
VLSYLTSRARLAGQAGPESTIGPIPAMSERIVIARLVSPAGLVERSGLMVRAHR